MLSVVMLSVVMLNVVMLNVLMLSVDHAESGNFIVKVSVIILSVVRC
jgi:hypothetical protein